MRSLRLVLTVIRNPETGSTVRTLLDEMGHRAIPAADFSKAELLLDNGLCPDLLLVDHQASEPIETAQFMPLVRRAGKMPTCVLLGGAEEGSVQDRPESGIRYLHSPLRAEDLRSIIQEIEQPTGFPCTPEHLGSHGVAAPRPADSSSDEQVGPVIEELGEKGFFLAASPRMLEIHRQAKLIADADVNVLILGESGTGKEVVAQLIHKHSRRAKGNFLKVNCAALPAELLESELFGHQKGAFTGAIKDRPGKFEQANHGTLLLDEIGEMSAQMQAKLLHVLQDGSFSRLGGQEAIQTDLRVLAATNVHMESALKEKKFREDLYYRLSVFTLSIPPLRQRREEIPFLIEEIIRRSPAEMRSGWEGGFSSKLTDLAVLCDWRGNIRELRNFVTRTIIMRDTAAAERELEGKIETAKPVQPEETEDRPELRRSGMRTVVRDLKDRTEAQLIQDALEASGWNRRHAAQDLNISYRGLLYKIQQHSLTPRMPRKVGEGARSARSLSASSN